MIDNIVKTNKTILFLSIGRLITSLGNFVYPFLTFYLTKKVGLDPGFIGLFFLIVSILYIPGTYLGGLLGDILGHKKVLLISQMMVAILFLIILTIEDQYVIIVLLLGSMFFNSSSNSNYSSLYSHLSEPENRTTVFTINYYAFNIGTAVSSALAGFLFERYINLIFILDAVTIISSLVIIMFLVPINEKEIHNVKHEKTVVKDYFSVRFFTSRLFIFTIILLLTNLIYSQHSFSLPLFLNEFNEERGPKLFGLIMMANSIVVLVFTPLLSLFAKKISPKSNIIIGCLAYALGFGILSLGSSTLILFCSVFIWTLGEILISINVNVYVSLLSEKKNYGKSFALVRIISGFGFSLGPLLAGQYLLLQSYLSLWLLIGVISFFCGVFLYFFNDRNVNGIQFQT